MYLPMQCRQPVRGWASFFQIVGIGHVMGTLGLKKELHGIIKVGNEYKRRTSTVTSSNIPLRPKTISQASRPPSTPMRVKGANLNQDPPYNLG